MQSVRVRTFTVLVLAGFDIPWVVARASFLPQTSTSQEERVIAGQNQVIDGDPLVFAGPMTDDLLGEEWRWDDIHFNEAGLREHAARWGDAIRPVVVPEPSSVLLGMSAAFLVTVTLRRLGHSGSEVRVEFPNAQKSGPERREIRVGTRTL